MHRIVVNELLSVYFIKLLQFFFNISIFMTTDNEDDSMFVT